jgi:UTP--glucose-1-phosphate uridylyltransferase
MVAIERLGREPTTPHGAVDAHPVAVGERVERVVGIVDRPGPAPAASLSAVAGRYLLSPAIFDALAAASSGDGEELHLTDGLQRLLACEPVFAYRFEGRRFDCGSKLGFLEATVNFALGHPEVGEAFAQLLGGLDGSPAIQRRPATHGRRSGAARRARATPLVPN